MAARKQRKLSKSPPEGEPRYHPSGFRYPEDYDPDTPHHPLGHFNICVKLISPAGVRPKEWCQAWNWIWSPYVPGYVEDKYADPEDWAKAHHCRPWSGAMNTAEEVDHASIAD